MTETEHYRLKQPEGNEYVGPGAFNENAAAIDGVLHGLEVGKASLDPETGKVKAEELPEMDYEGALKDAPAKETPADTDGMILVDGADGKTKRLLWSRMKATLKGWLDTLYETVGNVAAHDVSKAAHANMHFLRGLEEEAAEPVPLDADTLQGKHAAEFRDSSWVPGWDEVTGKPGTFSPAAHSHGPADLTSPVPLNKGGTGKTTAEEARAALGACGAFGPVLVTVDVSAWAGAGPWTQTVSVAGVTAADNGIGVYPVDIADGDARKLYEAAYGCLAAEAETVAGGVKLTCREKKPETSFQIKVQGVK